MNTQIVKKINLALQDKETENREEAMSAISKSIVYAHNTAVDYGFLELPLLESRGGMVLNDGDLTICVSTRPETCEPININDLYALKGAWGADDLDVYGDGTIELRFHNK